MTKPNCCEHCNDGDGNCAYPYYGVAPHECFWKKTGGFNNPLGTSTLLPREEWPENFSEDPEAPGCGIYTHCTECGRPNETPATGDAQHSEQESTP
ncbi:hypothetical protein GCM10011348_46450 [Marinobacterium nitratireducens]|uniref:Uncharacterized protein n=1 Tax=Marinobacterium nitratireducens TaxID=518897 RepID=A0A917ZS76_9GAMM|nr:hypothetical protein [Marinobacterium nitratireducens]GGO89217.1 hypothetical protein GCM10011348_46450 [Marinobacterium nitratireducens]